MPNLVPNVKDVQIRTFRVLDDLGNTENGLFLWFDSRAQNLGTVPVQLTVDEIEGAASSAVSQCVSWRVDQLCRETESVGGFTWHESHTHFHYEDFAAYQLRLLAPDGRPDYSAGGLLRVSDKVSFCLVDTEPVRDDARPTPLYTTCQPTVQGISAGWTDVYDASLAGQSFSIADLVDGRYALIVDLDYADHIHETDDADNYLEVTIEISGGLSQVSVLDRRWPAPDDRGTATTTTMTTTATKGKKPKKDR